MTPRRRNIVVGLVVLLGLAITTWMILLFAGRMASLFAAPGLPVTMKSERADGVTQGSTIYYRGVPAGRVTGVHLESNNQGVVITTEINRQPPLPANVVPIIRTQSAFGNAAQIDLEVNGAPSGQLTANAQLQATYEGSALIPKQFTQLAEEVHRQQLLEHLDQAVLSIQQQSERAGKLLESFQQIVGDPSTRNDLRTAVTNIRTATEAAVRVGNNMEKFTGRLDRIGDKADASLSDVRGAVAKLDGILDRFQSVATKIDKGQGTAGLLVNDPKLYQGLVDTTKELSLTVATLQRVAQQWEQEGVTLKLAK
jgi:phospholipid/cholesterol/gamma-HCH transport system substrate-binding protein